MFSSVMELSMSATLNAWSNHDAQAQNDEVGFTTVDTTIWVIDVIASLAIQYLCDLQLVSLATPNALSSMTALIKEAM